MIHLRHLNLKVHPLVISHSYWTWPIDCLSIKHGDFPVRYSWCLPEGTSKKEVFSSTWYLFHDSFLCLPQEFLHVYPHVTKLSWEILLDITPQAPEDHSIKSVVLPSGHRTPSRHAMHWRSMSCPRKMMDSMDWMDWFFRENLWKSMGFESVFIIKYFHVINKFLCKRSLQPILWKWETCGSRYTPHSICKYRDLWTTTIVGP